MVSSTSAGRWAEAVKARQPLRPARCAGLFSDRIICCRSIVEREGGRWRCLLKLASPLTSTKKSRVGAKPSHNAEAVIGRSPLATKSNSRAPVLLFSSPTHSRAQFIVGRLGVLSRQSGTLHPIFPY
jgi:hypothetical protein